MALARNLFFLLLYHLLLLNPADSKCQKSFDCGELGSLEFPFSRDPGCGLFLVDNCHTRIPKVQLAAGGHWYEILKKLSTNKFLIRNHFLQALLDEKSCLFFPSVSLPQSPSSSLTVSPNLTLFGCFNPPPGQGLHDYFKKYMQRDCPPSPFTFYYKNPTMDVPAPGESSIPQECSMFQVPIKSNQDQDSSDLFNLLTAEFTIEWSISKDCYKCYRGGGQCLNNMNEFYCRKGNSGWKLTLAMCGGGVLLLLLCLSVSYIFWLRKKLINGGYLFPRNVSLGPPSKSDIEGGIFYFGIPIFSYRELEEATNNFEPSKELGDGGYGTVYYGKLRDGREVAIKRLYERNYRRVEQFLNEIKILICLRHPNLVSLYGCTSRRSQELLLVYEYIPNGTVADHLHGKRAKEASLTWSVRMKIAIETATALAYLHKSDIIHRDIKTNNILLDNSFCVKVADFGLSRLFPNDVTHISTTPQGTPGYVDPQYQQCYQLTDKSDVYSFGVVLIELISSMPAVDISRHWHEINLANLAVNRIRRCEFDELIDPSLGYNSDAEVTRMTTSMAELAFRCLQHEKNMRPSMDEVLTFLKDIEGGEDCNFEQIREANGNYTGPGQIPPSPERDDAGLLKNKNFQSSPTAVTDRWASSGPSGSTTANSIG